VPGMVGLEACAEDPARVRSAARAAGRRELACLVCLVVAGLVLLCRGRGEGLAGGGLFASQRRIAATATEHR